MDVFDELVVDKGLVEVVLGHRRRDLELLDLEHNPGLINRFNISLSTLSEATLDLAKSTNIHPLQYLYVIAQKNQ